MGDPLQRRALEQDRACRGWNLFHRCVIKPHLARVPAKEAVQRERLDRLVRQQHELALFPIVRAAGEVRGLAPQGSAIRIDDVHVERVAIVGAAADVLGLAPAADYEGCDVRPVERERLAGAELAFAFPALANNALGATASFARCEREALLPGNQWAGLPCCNSSKPAVDQQLGSRCCRSSRRAWLGRR